MDFNRIKALITKHYVYYLVVLFLFFLILFSQTKLWFGDHGYLELKKLKNEIIILQKGVQELEIKNTFLQKEKARLSEGRDAIEGLARAELGLIKPDEVFYIFQENLELKVTKDISNTN